MKLRGWKRGLVMGGAALAALPGVISAGEGDPPKHRERAEGPDHGPAAINIRLADKDKNGAVSKDEFTAFALETMFGRMDNNSDGTIDDVELKQIDEIRDRARERFGRPDERRPRDGRPGPEGPRPEGGRPEGPPPGEGPEFGPDGVTPRAPRPESRERFRGGDMSAFGENLEISQLIVKELDANGDGKLGKDEAPERVAAAFEKLDTNKDGVLDGGDAGIKKKMKDRESERGAAMERVMEKMDKNGDGKVSADEAPPKLAERFDTLDANKDGSLDKDELGSMRPEGPGGKLGRKSGKKDGDDAPATAEPAEEKPAA